MTDRMKNAGKSLLRGLEAIGTALNDGPARTRIREIDAEIHELQQERNYLLHRLCEPLPNEKPDPDFDPQAYRPRSTVKVIPGEGRLVECKGRNTTSRYHGAHPGCPYVEQIHIAHDFKLKD